MEKCWLIRTKNNHILGPISKNKIRELLAKGTIRAEDELSSGNGYWFFAKEEDFIEKYINGDITQAFNPVCEATPLSVSLAKAGLSQKAESSNSSEPSGEEILPSDSDLEFPDMDMSASSESSSSVNEIVSESENLPDDSDLEFPDLSTASSDEDSLWGEETLAPQEETLAPQEETLAPQEIEVNLDEESADLASIPDADDGIEMDRIDEDSTGEIAVDTMLDKVDSNVITMEDIRSKKMEFSSRGDGILPSNAPQKFMVSNDPAPEIEAIQEKVVESTSFFSEKKIVILGWILFLVIGFVVLQRHQTVKDIIVDKLSGGIISDADAQETKTELIKKKNSP